MEEDRQKLILLVKEMWSLIGSAQDHKWGDPLTNKFSEILDFVDNKMTFRD